MVMRLGHTLSRAKHAEMLHSHLEGNGIMMCARFWCHKKALVDKRSGTSTVPRTLGIAVNALSQAWGNAGSVAHHWSAWLVMRMGRQAIRWLEATCRASDAPAHPEGVGFMRAIYPGV